MGREKPATRRARERARYDTDPVYREKIKAQRRAYYLANKEKVKAKVAAHRKANPGRVWEMEIKRRYGLTREQWDRMVIDQGGKCAICSSQLADRICVDHDHVEGHVRGLLCSPCNTGLGHFRDDVSVLSCAIDYLRSTIQR